MRGALHILFATVAAVGTYAPVAAQAVPPEESEGPIPDIIVTAEKRETSLQETPLAITAVSGDILQDRMVQSVADFAQLVPNVNFGQTTGNARIAIRGVGFDNITVGNEGRVAYHVDGIYLSRPIAALGTFFDVERVEVLRGPQGTLYGRNATAGAVNLITRDPENQLGGYVRLTAGNFDLLKSEAALSVPISDSLSARIAFQSTDRDGYGRNITTGLDIDDEKTRSARGKLRWSPSASVEILLSGDYHHEDDSNYGYHYFGPGNATIIPLGLRLGGIVAPRRGDMAGDVQSRNARETWGTALVATIDLGPELTLLTGYRESRFDQEADLDTTSVRLANFAQYETSEQFSQEVRLAGEFPWGEWIVGAYYFSEAIEGATTVAFDRRLIGQPAFLAQGYYAGGAIDTEAMAAFGQVRFEVARGLALVAAARYSTERKEVDEQFQIDFARPFDPAAPVIPSRTQQDATRWNAFTPKLGIEYKANEDLFFYATVSKGFKSGGYNLGGVQPGFKPETIWDYEAGLKSDLFQGRVRANLSAFYYDYTNLQVSKVVGTAILIENAARAALYGVEGEFLFAPTDDLQFDLAVSLLKSEYEEFKTADPARPALGIIDLAGNRLTQAPGYTFNAGVQYTWHIGRLDVTARAESYSVGRVYFSPYNLDITSQPAQSRFNAFLNFEHKAGWTGSLFVRNIGNNRPIGTAAISTGLTGFPVIGTLQAPRTFGVQVGYRF